MLVKVHTWEILNHDCHVWISHHLIHFFAVNIWMSTWFRNADINIVIEVEKDRLNYLEETGHTKLWQRHSHSTQFLLTHSCIYIVIMCLAHSNSLVLLFQACWQKATTVAITWSLMSGTLMPPCDFGSIIHHNHWILQEIHKHLQEPIILS